MFKIWSLLLLFASFEVIFAYYPFAQVASLYKSREYSASPSGGKSLTLNGTYILDLSQHDFNKMTHSVCITGIWLFYINKNFNQGHKNGVEYLFGTNEKCMNLGSIGGYVSSVRFVGSPMHYGSDTITLFEEEDFQGIEEYTFVNLPKVNLTGQHKSLIITGEDGWVIFDQPDYKGNAFCMISEPSRDWSPLFLPDLKLKSIPYGSIRSIKKGCRGVKFANIAEFGRNTKAGRKAQDMHNTQDVHELENVIAAPKLTDLPNAKEIFHNNHNGIQEEDVLFS